MSTVLLGTDRVHVGKSRSLGGLLRFQSDAKGFIDAAKPLDRYDSLARPEKLLELEELVHSLGLEFEFDGDAQEQYDFLKWAVATPFECSSPWLQQYSLHPFQHVGCNLAYRSKRFLVQWGTGTGKTILANLLIQKLFDEDLIDFVFVFCERPKRRDWEKWLTDYTNLRVLNLGNTPRAKRHDRYLEGDFDILVSNYEKARNPSRVQVPGRKTKRQDWSKTDLKELRALAGGRRCLFVFDEGQVISNRGSLVHKGCRHLVDWVEEDGGYSQVTILTATPYTRDPHNIHAIFTLLDQSILGGVTAFDQEYVLRWQETFYGAQPVWKDKRIALLGRRIADHTHIADKTDPEISKHFPETVERPFYIDLSIEDREVYNLVQRNAREEYDNNQFMGNLRNYHLLRVLCNTTEALTMSDSPLAEKVRTLMAAKNRRLSTATSEKLAALLNRLEVVFDENSKVVIFTFWRNMVMPFFIQHIEQRFDVPILTFTGGMSDDQSAAILEEFNAISGPAILFSSDAGKHGLNIYAPYLIHIEMPYTYADFKQRRDRIHRIDSMAQGISTIWVWRFIVTNSVEERTERMVWKRKEHMDALQGLEKTSEPEMNESTLRQVMFGS